MYSLPPSAYTQSRFSGFNRGCTLMFKKIENDSESNESSSNPKFSVVLGLSFLSQYASTFNINSRSIGFTPSKYSDDGVDLGKDPDLHDKPGISTKTLIIILVIVGIILLIGVLYCCIEQYQKRKSVQEAEMDDTMLEIRGKRDRLGSSNSSYEDENS